MGYYTQYSLGIEADINEALLGDSMRRDISSFIKEIGDKDDSSYWSLFKDGYDNDPTFSECWRANDSAKWYDHDQDMKVLSLRFPDVCFILEGEGEEEDDKWRKYYINGKVQECRAKITIVYPDFDLRKFKNIEKES